MLLFDSHLVLHASNLRLNKVKRFLGRLAKHLLVNVEILRGLAVDSVVGLVDEVLLLVALNESNGGLLLVALELALALVLVVVVVVLVIEVHVFVGAGLLELSQHLLEHGVHLGDFLGLNWAGATNLEGAGLSCDDLLAKGRVAQLHAAILRRRVTN